MRGREQLLIADADSVRANYTGNTVVTDWAKRSQAYMFNTAAKGVLTGANSSSDWWTIAGLGLAGEAYQYWAGRGADVRPGVDRENPEFKQASENGLFRVPRDTVKWVLREGNKVGLNQNPCISVAKICHGMPISNALNTLPGFNDFATLHDGWGEWLDKTGGAWNSFTNVGSMPLALLVTYGSLLEQYSYINPESVTRVSSNCKHRSNVSCGAHLSALQTEFEHLGRLQRADFSAFGGSQSQSCTANPARSAVQAHRSLRVISPINAQPCLSGFALSQRQDPPSGGDWVIQLSPVPLEHRKRRVVRPQAKHPLAGVAEHARGLEHQLLHHRTNAPALGLVAHGGVLPV
jgi:filamentous hemagglutinin